MRYLVVSLFVLLLVSCMREAKQADLLDLQDKLAGKWKASAFDGELHEVWRLNASGWMEQEGFYIEQEDTLYAAVSRIEKVSKDIILFSVIRDANPKIFKAIAIQENELVFENKDYQNPYEVTYRFKDKNNYKRTIRGIENDSLAVYEFNFIRVE